MAASGPSFVSRSMRPSSLQRAAIFDYKISDVESWVGSSCLTTAVRLGMPTVRFGISFRTQKTVPTSPNDASI